MKQKLILSLALFIVSVLSVNAQVTIGSNDDPHPAAVLDLKSPATFGKGLLLPKAEIILLSYFGFEGDESEAEGMIVYCPGKYVDSGLYLWDGSKWVLLISTKK